MDGVIVANKLDPTSLYFCIDGKGWSFRTYHFEQSSLVRLRKEFCIEEGWHMEECSRLDLDYLIPTQMIENG